MIDAEQAMTQYSGLDNLEVMTFAKNYNRFLVDLIRREVSPNDCVLDFGAGLGTFVIPIKPLCRTIACVEIDRDLRQRLSDVGYSVSPDSKNISTGSIDLIYALNVLEHIEDDAAVLEEFRRVLKATGKVLIYVPAFKMLFSSMDHKVGHFRRYTKATLEEKLWKAGFLVKTITYVDSVGFLVTLVYKLVGSRSGHLSRTSLILFDRFLFPLSRILDLMFGQWFGKNLWVVAQPSPSGRS